MGKPKLHDELTTCQSELHRHQGKTPVRRVGGGTRPFQRSVGVAGNLPGDSERTSSSTRARFRNRHP